MAVENFDFEKLNRKVKQVEDEEGTVKADITEAKAYLSKFFYPLTDGTHAMFEDGKPTILQDNVMEKVYIKRFHKQLQVWYKTKTIPRKLICDINKPYTGENYVNISPQIMHKYNEYKTYDEDTKGKVQVMLDYVMEIWANGNKDVYDFLLKWMANVVKGVKNTSCIYAKGDEGIGKSTLTDFLFKYVLGPELSEKGKAEHLKGKFNRSLLGKRLVVFEELQFFSTKEWQAVDSELKDLITGEFASYEEKFASRITAKNVNNYIVNTNYNAIKGANGRRYLVLDINPKRMNDFAYFETIRKCFTEKVGEAFYSMLMEVDTKGFNSAEMPTTKSKEDLCVDLMSPLEKFLKFEYLLKNQGINKVKLIDLQKKYNTYCITHKFSEVSPQLFSKSMRELLGVEYKTIKGYNVYDVALETLQEVAKRKKWLHDLDNDVIQAEKEAQDEEDEEQEALNMGVDKTDRRVYNDELANLKKENEELRKRLMAYENKQEESKQTTRVVVVDAVNSSVFRKPNVPEQDEIAKALQSERKMPSKSATVDVNILKTTRNNEPEPLNAGIGFCVFDLV